MNDAPQQEPSGSLGGLGGLEVLHAKMRVTAAALGDLFGRGFDGKHTQEVFSLQFGDKQQAALGLYDFMGVNPSVVTEGMYAGAEGRQGVQILLLKPSTLNLEP